ncbi:hypothetical protein F2Q69_00005433 [Brassica cretica]|uniref:Uncharacterized protein n=1 Tax=Brassica cretica TaxID=69181 RepID=A0A8S9PBC5_BRACR|nr:hypothetical protein F2Q69_00005433 [Brassica cretica]
MRPGGGNLQGSLHKVFLDIGQKEVNRAWWQPPLRLNPWKPVQSWSLKEILSELTIRGRYEEETIDRCTSSDVDRYRREASTIEDYDRSMCILYHRSMSRRGSTTWFQPTLNPRLHQITRLPLTKKKDEWEIAYINTRINDVYNPLNNNVDWLSTRIDLLQQDLDTIRMNDPQPATSIDICNITSIDTRFVAMEERLKSYKDMHDRFTSPIMRYLDTLSTHMMNVQRDIGKLNDQHDFQEEGSTSIDRFRRTSLDGKKPPKPLPYTAAEVDQITSKLYKTIDTLEGKLEKRCDDIYFLFDVKLSGLDSQAEWLQKEVKAIQSQLAPQH